LGYEDQFPWEKQGSCVSQGLVWIFDGILDWMDAPNNELKGREAGFLVVQMEMSSDFTMGISLGKMGRPWGDHGETMGDLSTFRIDCLTSFV
jgi:hypothetical protein